MLTQLETLQRLATAQTATGHPAIDALRPDVFQENSGGNLFFALSLRRPSSRAAIGPAGPIATSVQPSKTT